MVYAQTSLARNGLNARNPVKSSAGMAHVYLIAFFAAIISPVALSTVHSDAISPAIAFQT